MGLALNYTLIGKVFEKISSSARPIIASSPDCVVFNCQSKFGTKHHKQRDTSHKPFPFTVRSNINKKKCHTKINVLGTTLWQSLDHSKGMAPRWFPIRILLLPHLSYTGPHQKWHANGGPTSKITPNICLIYISGQKRKKQ